MEMLMNSLFQGDSVEQFRMVRFQVYNWGTFSGLHDISISPEGHLFIGGSGSGKSTLLDAMSVLLTPGIINFNAAAREGEKRSDRTLLSYMRGAWTTQQDDEGRSVLQYLRKQSTWSALALTYESASNVVTLLFIGIIRGNTNDDARVLRHYYVVPDKVELASLSDFSSCNYDWSFIKKQLPEAKSYPRFAPYCEHFRKVFGVEEETVFKLLHKAQSARNLGDLNQFLRKFMLDVPKTFEVADLLVNQFTELYEAHSTVVKAREQVQLLSKAKEHHQKFEQAQKAKSYFEALKEYLPIWHLRQQENLLAIELPIAKTKTENTLFRYEQCCRKRDSINQRIEELTRLYYAQGGDRLIQIKAEFDQAKKQLAVAQKVRDRYSEQLQPLHIALPTTFDEFCQNAISLKNLQEQGQAQLQSLRQSHDGILVERAKSADEFKLLTQEINAMEATRSNIPAHLLKLRSQLVQALSLSTEDFPFVGELLEVREEEQVWQGAIERVLHNFSTSMLVSDKYYRDFVTYVNDSHLGTRLVYHRVRKPANGPLSLYENTLIDKLLIKDGAWSEWVERELAERFNYACVQKLEEFSHYERAITITGQVKHNRTRHEKDDRFNVNDRRRWVLGFSNEDKLALYKQTAQTVAQNLSHLESQLTSIADKEAQINQRIQNARVALEYEWEEVDTGSLSLMCRNRQKSYEEALENSQNLAPIEKEREELKRQVVELDREKEKAYSDWQECKVRQEELITENNSVKSSLSTVTINDEYERGISERARSFKIKLSLKTLSNAHDRIASDLLSDQDTQMSIIAAETTLTTSCFSEFKQRWPDTALQLDSSLMSAKEYFEKLDDLLKEGLPRFEKKFKDLLTNEVRQNLTDLYREIDDERRLIKSRLQEVNQSLTKVAFNRIGEQESHLRIDIADKNLVEVQDFKKLKNQILAVDLTQKELKAEQAERYFELVNTLVQKFNVNGNDLAAQRWRERVLDVRQHMDFYGVEYENTEEGQRIVEVYQSAAGKSGGQRQKLTVTCLAAALRYQLGGKENDYPSYAAVILDEAFDKADSEFTDIALNIFKDFHFQMIIATPEKSVMTLDPYVGGTTYVTCKNRNQSSVLEVVYDSKTGGFSAAN